MSVPHHASIKEFRERAFIAIEDVRLQDAMEAATGNFRASRLNALAELPQSEQMRDHFKATRSATLGNLAEHLETFETNAIAAGANVHWAQSGADACQVVLDIARRRQAKLVTKSKSMATEEIHLNETLEAAGIEIVETDLGEWIIQKEGEGPSHIIAPAIHKTRGDVARLLKRETGKAVSEDDLDGMMGMARGILRQQFLASDIGISGGNIIVAESGSLVIVTNEGNADMVTSTPKVHIALIGIEKIAATWDDAAVWLQLLARSATGQPLSIYTTIVTGSAREHEPDGPEEVHIILLDNGRSDLIGTPYEEALQCIRCGACLNACPVYREAGGHAYGSPYSGPIGAIISPLIFGLDKFEALPHASSLCGACKDVCPARIDIPRILLELRAEQVEKKLAPLPERKAEEWAASLLGNQNRMKTVTKLLRLLQRPLVKDGKLALPERLNPTLGRELPNLAPKSFREMWADGEV